MSDLNFQNNSGNSTNSGKANSAEKQQLINEIRKADSFYKTMNLDFFSIEELTLILKRLNQES